MSLKCNLGLHDWSKDCEKCSKCGNARDKGHDWSENCEKCSKCYKTRYTGHKWTGCKCSQCGATRGESHKWVDGICSMCGTPQDSFDAQEAAKTGNAQQLAELLRRNPNLVFSRDHKGWTPLHTAAYEGQRAVAEMLLAHGADVNAKAADGYTPLHSTALSYKQEGQQELAELLLAHSANPNAETEDGHTPLQIAAFGGKRAATAVLLPRTKRNKDDLALNMAIVHTLEPGSDPTKRIRGM